MSEKRNENFFFIENYIGNSSQVHENRHPEKLMLNNINKFSISEDDAYDISGMIHLESIVGKTRGKTRKKKGKKRKKNKWTSNSKIFRKRELFSAKRSFEMFVYCHGERSCLYFRDESVRGVERKRRIIHRSKSDDRRNSFCHSENLH